jgi:hypothetical protein
LRSDATHHAQDAQRRAENAVNNARDIVSIFPVKLTTGQELEIFIACRPVKVEVVTKIGAKTVRWK